LTNFQRLFWSKNQIYFCLCMVSLTQNYELYFILNPELSADQIDQEVNRLVNILEKDLQAYNLNVEKQGLKRLAYAIKRHHTGFYVLIDFDLDLENAPNVQILEKKLNLDKEVMRYIIVNQTEFLRQKSKEKPAATEITHHNELNKKAKRPKERKCIVSHLGLRVIDYKDVEFLQQFVSPYAKIFSRQKTGTKAKFQRKIAKAIKRARHMALLPFTPQD